MISKRIVLATFIDLLVAATAQAGAWAGSGSEVLIPFSEMESGEASHYPIGLGFSSLHIDNEPDFEIFWRAHTGDITAPIPYVDFSRNDVIAVFNNRRGSDFIRTLEITMSGRQRNQLFYETGPECTCPRPDSPTAAYQIIVTAIKLQAPLSFHRGGRMWACNGVICPDL